MTKLLSPCAQEVRKHDWDRFLFTLFAPQEEREDLFTFLAFNSEVARTREMVSEPFLGQIRLQWWQNAIDGIYDGTLDEIFGHYILEDLARLIRKRGLTKALIDQLISTRFADLSDEPPKDEQALIDYAFGTSAVLNILLLEILGARESLHDKAGELGIAWSLTGLMRALPLLAEQGRSPLPLTLIKSDRTLKDFDENVSQAVRSVCILAQERLVKSRNCHAPVGRTHRPVFLSSILTDQYLKQFAKSGYNPFCLKNGWGRIGRQISVGVGSLIGGY